MSHVGFEFGGWWFDKGIFDSEVIFVYKECRFI